MSLQSERYHDLAGTLRTAFLQALLLALIAILIAAAFNACRPNGLKWLGQGPLPEEYAKGSGTFETISLEDAFSGYTQGTLVFIDARSSTAFRSGHLPGAHNIPPENVSSCIDTLRGATLLGKTPVVYCDGPGCDLSLRVASLLAEHGFPGIQILTAGWEGWYDAGFPIEQGERP